MFTKMIHFAFFCLIAICLLSNITLAADVEHRVLESKKILIDNHPVYYFEAGQGPTIVLVHGLFANKEQWKRMIPLLAAHHYHVIAPDLPGYGKSLGFSFDDYQLNKQVTLLHDFVNKLHPHQFHIAGNSMGGAISALFTLKYPNDILSLTFIGSPLGITSPKPSETDQLFARGFNPFLPTTQKQFNQLMDLLFVHKPIIPQPIVDHTIHENIVDRERKKKIIELVHQYQHLLDKPINFPTPVLIIWGDKDKIFDVSGAYKLHHNIRKSTLVILKNTGHLPHIDCANSTAHAYENFLVEQMQPRQLKLYKTHVISCSYPPT